LQAFQSRKVTLLSQVIDDFFQGKDMFGKKILITKYDYDRLQKMLNSNIHDEYPQPVEKLKEKIKKAKLIDSREIRPTVITMNSRFILKNLGNGKKKELALVFPGESDPDKNKISIFDRFGAELFTHEEGEVINISGDDSFYLIENITYQPEAAGDYHL